MKNNQPVVWNHPNRKPHSGAFLEGISLVGNKLSWPKLCLNVLFTWGGGQSMPLNCQVTWEVIPQFSTGRGMRCLLSDPTPDILKQKHWMLISHSILESISYWKITVLSSTSLLYACTSATFKITPRWSVVDKSSKHCWSPTKPRDPHESCPMVIKVIGCGYVCVCECLVCQCVYDGDGKTEDSSTRLCTIEKIIPYAAFF